MRASPRMVPTRPIPPLGDLVLWLRRHSRLRKHDIFPVRRNCAMTLPPMMMPMTIQHPTGFLDFVVTVLPVAGTSYPIEVATGWTGFAFCGCTLLLSLPNFNS